MPAPKRPKPPSATLLRQNLAENLMRLRDEKGLRQEDVAWDAGLNKGYVSKIENSGANVTVDNVERIALALKVDPWLLLEPPPEGTPRPTKANRRRSGDKSAAKKKKRV